MALLFDAHAVTFVFSCDVAALKPFYTDILGLTLLAEDPFAATFDLGGGTTLRLTAIENHAPSPHTVLGWVVPDIVAAIDALAGKGIACQHYEGFGQDERGIWTSPAGGAKIAWFLDPEGNNLSLTQL